ncbi:MAG: shikimate kinase [Zhongshania sp.]|uniref:shikimate kinase n=1 Tax=Zhongshania sp. TaxID=1971902 RepID=UPI0026282E3B|nr:shikimate kinase [Zhongshania sp.]MDF1691818.1 shikimate kinase [Zhongshania sp.]
MSRDMAEASKSPAIILIGMPGAGKSTIGAGLASARGLPLVDSDRLIEQNSGQTLQALLDNRGYIALRELEEQVLLAHNFAGQVVATGGSAVYSAVAMSHLKACGPCVFLDIPLAEIEARVQNFQDRGIAGPAGQSLAAVYAERLPLYQRYADIVVDGRDLNEVQLLAAVQASLS